MDFNVVLRTDDVVSLEQKVEALQARIDELMLVYCPDEMTDEQVARWAASQKVAEDQ